MTMMERSAQCRARRRLNRKRRIGWGSVPSQDSRGKSLLTASGYGIKATAPQRSAE
jgi:hypothetical protein